MIENGIGKPILPRLTDFRIRRTRWLHAGYDDASDFVQKLPSEDVPVRIVSDRNTGRFQAWAASKAKMTSRSMARRFAFASGERTEARKFVLSDADADRSGDAMSPSSPSASSSSMIAVALANTDAIFDDGAERVGGIENSFFVVHALAVHCGASGPVTRSTREFPYEKGIRLSFKNWRMATVFSDPCPATRDRNGPNPGARAQAAQKAWSVGCIGGRSIGSVGSTSHLPRSGS